MVAVIDVLRFTTAVEAALGRGASVFPYRWRDDSAPAFAESVGATLAEGSDPSGPSLSPLSLCRLNAGDAVVLPSPNGSTCTAIAAEAGAAVVAACLRNLSAVADWLNDSEGPAVVIACGERWSDGSLRPCIEDLLGAGALIGRLRGSRAMSQRRCTRRARVASSTQRITATTSPTQPSSMSARLCRCCETAASSTLRRSRGATEPVRTGPCRLVRSGRGVTWLCAHSRPGHDHHSTPNSEFAHKLPAGMWLSA